MTVSELFIALSKLDGDMPVMVQGYEGGLTDLKEVEVADVVLNENKYDSYSGPHARAEMTSSNEPPYAPLPGIKAVILPR